MSSLFLLVFSLGLLWFWFDTLRAREVANALCRELCARYSVQLLDHTIALESTALRRNSKGRLKILRGYRFDYYMGGNERGQGSLLMLGSSPAFFELPGHERIILPV